jgi:hypothetical protein
MRVADWAYIFSMSGWLCLYSFPRVAGYAYVVSSEQLAMPAVSHEGLAVPVVSYEWLTVPTVPYEWLTVLIFSHEWLAMPI